MNLKSSIIWTGLLRVFSRGLTITKTLILARILTPSQFGIFGIASLILGFLETMTETGVNVVLIQEKDNIKHYINTGWVVSIFRGFLIAIIIILLSPIITYFFDSAESLYSLRLISLIPIIRGFINPAIVLYQKNLQFKQEFKFRSVIIFFEVIITVMFGLILGNETAFIYGMIASSLIEVSFSFILLKPRPTFKFNLSKLKSVLAQGEWITMAKIFDYLFSHGDDILVGKLLGTYSLGIYQQAYRISSLPIIEVTETFQKVMFPTYSNILSDRKLISKTYLKTLFLTLLLVIPFGVIIYLFPKQTILLFLGNNWLSAQPVLQILAVFGILKTIANSSFPLLLAYRRQDLVMLLTLIGIIGLGVSIYPLIDLYGLAGAGLSTIVGSLLMIPPAFYYVKKYTNINFK